MQNFEDDLLIPSELAWQILDRSADPVVTFDAVNLTVNYLNSAASKLAQESCAGGQELTDLSAWLNLGVEETQTRFAEDVLSQQGSFNLEAMHEGLFFDVSVQYLPTPDGSNQLFLHFRDVTKHHEAERRKQELVSTVSHELRSPLTAIKGAMGLLLAGSAGELPKRAYNMVQIAQRNADRLVLIINDILDLDKITDGAMVFDKREVRIAEVIDTAVETITGFSARFDVDVVVHVETPDAVSFVDPNRLVQVLVNLLSNAIKFSPTGGKVTVGLTQLDGHNRLSIADTGEGIPKAEHALLFQRFVQIGAKNRAATGGTGLGLSIVQAILEKQDGKVSFESEVGQGTTFYVDIPIHEGTKYLDQVTNGLSA